MHKFPGTSHYGFNSFHQSPLENGCRDYDKVPRRTGAMLLSVLSHAYFDIEGSHFRFTFLYRIFFNSFVYIHHDKG